MRAMRAQRFLHVDDLATLFRSESTLLTNRILLICFATLLQFFIVINIFLSRNLLTSFSESNMILEHVSSETNREVKVDSILEKIELKIGRAQVYVNLMLTAGFVD